MADFRLTCPMHGDMVSGSPQATQRYDGRKNVTEHITKKHRHDA